MASDYANLNFHNRADIRRWQRICEEQREIALKWPAFDPGMIGVEEYRFILGPWRLCMLLEIWQKPYLWHTTACCVHQVGFQTVGLKLEVPEDRLIGIREWLPEHFEQARFLMAHMLGPYLRSGDKFQQVQESQDPIELHWRLRYEGPETWKNQQN